MPLRDTFPAFYASILFQSRLSPYATAVVTDTGEVSYRAFCTDIERVTRRLQQLRLPAGSRAAVHVRVAYLRWLAIIALARLGVVSVSPSETGADLDWLGVTTVLSDHPEALPHKDAVDFGIAWLDSSADALPRANDIRHDADAPCRLVVSSGTTGVPKRAMLTYGQIRSRMRSNIRAYGLNTGARLLNRMGPGTIGGFMMLISCWSAGGAVILPSPGPLQARRDLVKLRPNLMMVSPAQLAALLGNLPRDQWPRERLAVYVAGSALAPPVSLAARLRLSELLFVIYGSTEAGSVTMAHASVADARPGFTGYVLPTAEVEIVNEQRASVAVGEMGEVRIRAEGMVEGYVDDTLTNDTAFIDGWFYPGDLGILSADGGLSIVGRTRELMNFGGVKIAPERVEDALAACSDATEIAAFSVLDFSGTERPYAAVVAGASFDDQAIKREFAKSFPRLPALTVVHVDSLPRNEMGKILRLDLAERVRKALLSTAAAPSRLLQ